MSFNLDDSLEGILDTLKDIKVLNPEDFPSLDLYMDQVTSFMNKNLAKSSRNFEMDKLLTKTMINNYAKNDLLPPPDKKKYSKEHMVILMFIYYFKNVLSIKDIQSVLNPLTDRYFGRKHINIEKIYSEIIDGQEQVLTSINEDVKEKYEGVKKLFADCSDDDKDMLSTFAFITDMVIDIYLRKLIVHKLIDEFAPSEDEELPKEKDKKKK